jgi:hypothetical protein
MGLDNETAHRVSSEETTLSEEVSTPSLFPLEANQPHDVWSVLGKLAKEGAIAHPMPYVVHVVQLLAAALVFLGEH